MDFIDCLGTELIFVDGAMGTMLQVEGLKPGYDPMLWNIENPDQVLKVHSEYLKAGAQIITTNTFGANALKLSSGPYSVEEVIGEGVAIARRAIDEVLRSDNATISQQETAASQKGQQEMAASQKSQQESAASQEGYVALGIGPLGQMLEPLGQISFDHAVDMFKEQVLIGTAAGADLTLIETMLDTYELKAAVLAAKEASELPIFATVAINEQGRLLNGADLTCVCTLLEGLGVDALGINCGAGPTEVAPYVEALDKMTSLPLILSPNAGLPVIEDGATLYEMNPEAFAHHMLPLVRDYGNIAGGCCGTTPAHIEALVTACAEVQPKLRERKAQRRVSSFSATVYLDEADVIVDQRIDVAKDAELLSTLQQGSYDHAVDLVFDALDDDAQVIGVCTASSELDETNVLPELVQKLQELSKVPLLLCSADRVALERALRIYNGCPAVDLSMLPLEEHERARISAARYGAVIV